MQDIENAYVRLAGQLQQAIDAGDFGALKDLSFLMNLSRITFVEPDEYNGRKVSKPIAVYAAEHGTVEIMSFLIEIGCDVNARDSFGNTPLMAAVSEDRFEMVVFLMKQPHVQKYIQNYYGETVSSIAWLNNNPKIVEYLEKNFIVGEGVSTQSGDVFHAEKNQNKFLI